MSLRNFQVFVFGNYSEFKADANLIREISDKLFSNGLSLIPGTFQEVVSSSGLKPEERIMYKDSKDQFLVEIGVESIRINKIVDVKKTYNLIDELDEFLLKAKKFIKSLFEISSQIPKGQRMSLIIDTIYDNDNIRNFNDVYMEFNRQVPGYEADEVVEWYTRAVKRVNFNINDNDEVVNVVTEVNRSEGEYTYQGKRTVFNTILSKIDINTFIYNNSPRMDFSFVGEYLEKSKEVFISQNENLEVRIIEQN